MVYLSKGFIKIPSDGSIPTHWALELKEGIHSFGMSVGVAVGRRSGGRLATTLVATISAIIFFFSFYDNFLAFLLHLELF